MRILTLALGLVFAAIWAAQAQAEEKRIALLIGNEAYPEEVGRLNNPHDDIDAVAVALADARFAPDDIIIVKDAGKDAMLQAVSEFMARLKAADGEGVGFFYFSGHGASAETAAERRNYLIPSDAPIKSAEELPLYALPLDSVIEGISSINAKSVFVISDACRNTLPISAGAKSLGGAGNKGFSPVAMRPGLFVAYATADGATAPDDGVFGAAIAEQIRRPNQVASRAFELAFREVVQTRENAALPFVSPGLTEDFCFVSCPEETPASRPGPGAASQAELDDWRAAIQKDTREAFTEFAEKYPETFLGGEARAMAVIKPTAEEKAQARQVGGDAGDDAVKRTLDALESLTESLEGLARLGGVIDNPESVTDFYNNARVYERRGDTLNARKMYERAIALGVDAVDVHYAYVAILKAQEGLIGAREIYADLSRDQADNRSAQLAHATVLPGAARQTKLESLAESASDFGPVNFELARLYSLDRLGAQTNADKDAEKKWLAGFREADAAGRLQRWFLDDSLLEAWRADVERRWAVYEASKDAVPISFTARYSNSGWTITTILSEPAAEISYQLPGQSGFTATPKLTTLHPQTGKPMPTPYFELPLGAKAQRILVKYIDRNGAEQGPFEYLFDPAAARRASDKQILKSFTGSWVAGRDYDGRKLLYFTHLMSYRCHLDQIEWGVSADSLDRTWPVAPCNQYGEALLTDEVQVYTEIPDQPATIYVRLTFDDGEQTGIVGVPVRY